MRWITLCTLALLVLALSVAPVLGCINDRESIKSEKEFKSNYEKPQPAPEYKQPENKERLMVLGGTGIGLMLLCGAVVIGFKRPKLS